MALLKDTVVLGSLRVTDSIYSNSVLLSTLLAPTASDESTYGPGTNEYVLMSNGTSVYWGAGVSNAIKALDVNTIGNANGTKYIAAISLADGKISATAVDVATTYSATGTTAVSGKSIAAALDTLDFSSIGVAAATGNRFVSLLSQTDGKISAVLGTATIGSNKLPVYINAGTITAVTAKDTANNLINALDTGSSNLTANDYVITQYVGGGTTTTTYHRRPASAIRVGGLLTARKLKVDLSSTTDVTFDGTADKTNIPISNTLGVANGGTGNNANYTLWGIVYASTTTKLVNTAAGATDTALMGKGSAAPAFVAVSTTLATSTAATASAGLKLKVTVLGVASSEIELSKATTGLYGVTKLTDSYTSTDGTLATTGKALLAAILTLDVSAVGGGTGEYISKISETDGKISATKSTTTVSNTWTDGTTTGPTIKTTVNGINGTAVAIPAATASKSGVVTTEDLTFNGNKTFNDNVTAKEFIGKLKGLNIIPTLSKVYESTSFYGSANTDASCCYYMASIKPDSFYKPWSVRFRVRSFCPGHTNVDSVTYGLLTGRNTGSAYANWNERYDHAHYYTTFHPLTQAGFDAGYAHAFGVNIVSSTNRTTAGYYRTFEIDIYSYEGCTVELLDTPVLWANWPNNSTTNYTTLINCNAVDRGLQETGDANQTWASDLYTNNGNWKAVNLVYRYYILFELRPGYLVSVSGNNNAAGTTNKTMLDEPFDAFGQIFYYNTTSAVAPAANVGAGYLMYAALADMRYSFNIVNTTGSTAPILLIAHNPVYLKVLPLGGKMVKIDNDHPLTMEEAATDDGYWYIYLGQAYDWYRVRLINYHPVYHFKNGTWSLVVPPVEKVNLTTTLNAVAYYVDATGTFGTKASANGALYATSTNGSLQWGTLPVAQGGTGTTAQTANRIVWASSTTALGTTGTHYFDGSTLALNSNAVPTGQTLYVNGLMTAISYGSSWLDGLRYFNAAYNVDTVSNSGSYLPWMRMTNNTTGDGGYWFSMGTWKYNWQVGGSKTSYTTNGFLLYMRFNLSNGFLYSTGPISAGSGDVTADAGYLVSTKNGNTITIGSLNSDWSHITSSAGRKFYFSNDIHVNGVYHIYNNSTVYGGGYIELYGGTPYIDFHHNNSTADYTCRIMSAGDGIQVYRPSGNITWINIGNSDSQAGIYFLKISRGIISDGSGDGCLMTYHSGDGNCPVMAAGGRSSTERHWRSAFIAREGDRANAGDGTIWHCPRISLVWNGRKACTMELRTAGFYFMASPQTDGTRAGLYAAAFNSGSGNDYAEERDSLVLQPGKVVTETAVGKMVLAEERLLPGCRIVSDTYGMLVGQRDNGEFRAPIAVTGRALVYPYRDRTEYPLGAAVCSAPNGTVDIMTREEIMMYPERIIGTVSEIPTYELWSGSGIMGDIDSNVLVDGRIWVYVR